MSFEHALSDRALMRIQVETLFTHDARGRLLRVNEPGGQVAPRFFLGRTVEGNEWRFRHDVDDETVRALEALCVANVHEATRYAAILARGAPVVHTEAGPAYRFPRDPPASSDVVAITPAHAELLRAHLGEWADEVADRQPMRALLIDDDAVCLCGSVRIGDVAHEAGVETAQAFRGRGYAARVVAAWAIAVRELGRVPLYSTSWENAASRAVARKLGLRRYGSDYHAT